MARQNPNALVPNQNTILTITDINGDVVLEVRDEEMLVVGPLGGITVHSRTDSIQLVCGTIWTRAMLQAKPPVYLGVCESCRHPGASLWGRRARHGLVALHRAKLCKCGRLVCPNHRRLGRDNKWRCLSCHKKYTLGRLLRPIFFAQKGDDQ